jgi:hypothetical protein
VLNFKKKLISIHLRRTLTTPNVWGPGEAVELARTRDLALSLYVSSTMLKSVKLRYSYCRLPEDYCLPGDTKVEK